MDILGKYEQEHPIAVPQSIQRQQAEYGFFIRLVMSMSAGKIRDRRHASYVLLVAAGIGIIAALAIIFLGGSSGVRQPTSDLINRPQPQETLP